MSKGSKTRKKRQGHLNLHKKVNWNIGTVIFFALFIYIVISLVMYLTADHITSYQVMSGPLSKNQVYTAMAMRNETVVRSETNGYINYYAGNMTKVRKDGPVCSISQTKQKLQKRDLSDSELADIHTDISKFSRYYNQNSFESVYDFKNSLGESLQNQSITLQDAKDGLPVETLSSDIDGIVVYSADGMENLREEELTPEIFDKKTYKKENLKSGEKIHTGDSLYKVVTDDSWFIVIPISEKQASRLESKKQIKVKFLKDNESETGQVSVLATKGQLYAKIAFNSGMIRYINDRYLDVELVTNTKSGLKIPVSSIVKKDFYTVPAELLMKNSDNEIGFFKEIKDKDNVKTEFADATIYTRNTPENSEQELLYIDTDALKKGDILVNTDDNIRYSVGETAPLLGVYSMNKGYAVFRTISIIDQNKEYCIVDSKTRYGISQYDFIVLNGNTVKEKEILY